MAGRQRRVRSSRRRRQMVGHRHHHRDHELRDQVTQPHLFRLGQSDFRNGNQSTASREKDADGQQVDERTLLFNGPRGPRANDARAEVDAGHKPMDVVETTRGFWLAKRHL